MKAIFDPPFARLFALAISMSLAACTQLATRDDGGGTLFVARRIYLDAHGSAPVQALLVEDGRVVAAGSRDELEDRARHARVVHLGGVGVPGLVDAHGHLAGLGQALETVDLVGSSSYAEVVRRVQMRAEQLPSGAWIVGRGWDQSLWADASFPHHAPLSAAVPDHPVLLTRVDGHSALANRKALERGELFRRFDEAPQIEGGEVHLDDGGWPTGILIDRAMGRVSANIPEADRATRRGRLLAAQEACLAVGLVGTHDMGLRGDDVSILEELAASGELRLRVIGYLWGNDGLAPELAERYPGARDHDPANKLRIIGSKLMLDGALGSRGAALLDDYEDRAGHRGALMMSAEAFDERLDAVLAAGLQPATHAIGDHANRLLLDAYVARAGALANLRPRVEHAQVVSAADWARFERYGIIASMQPTHATTDMRWAEARLGPERVPGAYAWRRLADDPGTIALGSDFPVEPPDPLLGLYAARTRQSPAGEPEGGWFADQRLSGHEALAGFTTGAARAAFEEDARGRLAPGFHCDMTVFDVDPVISDPAQLLEARVLFTIIDGVVVYEGDSNRG